MTNEQIIQKLIEKYCDEVLDSDYLKICKDITEDYLAIKPQAMDRGKPEIWAASIIWAAGSVNFLSDPMYSPYATLSDVCAYFNTKNSTVGSKAGQIRKVLDMQFFNDKYLLDDSPLRVTLDKLRITKEGFIVFDHMLGDRKEDPEPDPEDDGEIVEITIKGKFEKPIARKTFYQFEFQLQKMVKNWIKSDGRERAIEVSIKEARELSIRLNCTKTEERKLRRWMKDYGFTEV